MLHHFVGDLALELADGADLVSAIVALDLGVVVDLLIEVEAIAAAFAALEFDTHS